MTDLTGYHKRTEYPADGPVVQEIIRHDDGTMTIVYDDYTFLVVRSVRP